MSVTEKDVVQPKPSGFEWEIENFFADCEKNGDYYTSPVFITKHSDKVASWSLRVYPKGFNKECSDHISLYLAFQSDELAQVTVDYRLSIANEQSNLSKLTKAKKFVGPSDNWGWKKFVEQNFVKNKKSVSFIDDTLTISCEIISHQINPDVMEKLKDYDNLLDKVEKGFEDYEKLLDTDCFSDITFVIQGEKMHLHKAILSCRNSVFKTVFEHCTKNEKYEMMTEVEITDVDYEVMKEVFRFIYSGKVLNIEKIAKDLLIAADKYSIDVLKAMCEKTLYHNLTVDNAIEYLKLVDACDTIHLKTLVIKFVVNHYEDVVTKPGFQNLNVEIKRFVRQGVAEKH